MEEGNQRAGAMLPPPADSAVEELPDGLLRAGYRHRAAPDLSQPSRLFGGKLALITFAEALASEEEDLGVFHQAIGDGSGDGGVVEDVAPVGKCCVGRDERAALIAMASGDDLIEEVGSLLIDLNSGPKILTTAHLRTADAKNH